MTTETETLLTVFQAAKLLGTSHQYVYQLVGAEKLTPVYVDRVVRAKRFNRSDILALKKKKKS